MVNLLFSIFYNLCAVDFKITEKTKIYDWVNEVFYDIEKGTLVQPKSYFVYDKNQVLSKEMNVENAYVIEYKGHELYNTSRNERFV